MKKNLLLSFLMLCSALTAWSQERAVSGKVTGEDGAPLPGVGVQVKGTTVGASTDLDGNYKISVQEEATLVFTFLGYTTQEMAVGEEDVINVTLLPSAEVLNEVVVTALGTSRQQRTLGYAASTVNAEELTAGRNVTAMTGIQGKVPGVSISNAGSAGGATKVIIRGVSSFTAGNQPLYIVDGTPINNSFKGDDTFDSSVDFGNQANDINPQDIKSVTILKGASATALYGSRAAHGVVMITTKSGNFNQPLRITYTGALNFSNALRLPQTQNVFGQGWSGAFSYIENGSWGPKLDGRMRDWGAEIDGVRREKPFAYVENNVRDFYEVGQDYTNSISISGGGEHNSYMFSYSNTGQNGVVPTDADKFSRNNFSFRGKANYGKFDANYSVNYIRRDMSAVFAGQGTSDGGAALFQDIIQTPVDVDLGSLKDYENIYNSTDYFYTVYAMNPWFILNENGTEFKDDRFYGNVELSYELTKGLKAIGRLGGDFSNTEQADHGAVVTYEPGSLSAINQSAPVVGRYGERYRKDNQLDLNLLLQGDYQLSDDVSLNATLGYNYNQRGFSYLDSYVSGLNVPDWYSLKNTSGVPVTESIYQRRRLMGVLGQFDFGFRDYWFVNVSLRNDWSSTLPVDNNSFFYGGVNSSLILTDMFEDLRGGKLDLLKLRAAWGQTGNDALPYNVYNNFRSSEINLGFGNIFLPLDGVAGLTEFNRLGNLILKPEITTEWEFGFNTRWFDNRITLDATYYNRHTKDQIIPADYAPETGITAQTLNIGNIQNQGVEVGLGLTPVRNDNFEWNIVTNFTKNVSKVKALYGDTREYIITSAYDVDYVAEIGQPVGVFKVPQAEYVASGPDAGKIIVNAAGIPKVDPNTKKIVGPSEPDFEIGFSNQFSYKNWSLSALIDWRKGGYFYSYTSQLMNFVGNSTETTFNERQPFLVPNSVKEVFDEEGNVTYAENDVPISMANVYAYWYANTNNTMYEHAVLKRDYLKLREVVLTYRLPESLVSKLSLQAVDLSLIGRNLLIFTPDSNNFVDPEGTNFGNDIESNFGEFATGPTMRSLGASLRVTF